MRYYQVGHEEVPGRCLYGFDGTRDAREIEPWQLWSGVRVEGISAVNLAVRAAGPDVDFGFAESVPLVRPWVGELIAGIAPGCVQRIPAVVKGGSPHEGELELLNIVTRRPCVDRARSHVWEWTPRDRQVGKRDGYKAVWVLYVTPSALAGTHICRVEEYPVVSVVSEGPNSSRLRRASGGTGAVAPG